MLHTYNESAFLPPPTRGIGGKGNRRIIFSTVLLMIASLATACAGLSLPAGSPATSTKPPAQVDVTHAPEPEALIRSYYDAWQRDDYAAMYAMLSASSQSSITEEAFASYYDEIRTQAAWRTVEYQIQSLTKTSATATASLQQVWHTILVGDITKIVTIPLRLEDGLWKIDWSYAIILPELAGGNRLSMVRQPAVRGTIYDRNSQPLAFQAEVVAVGLVPGEITDEDTVDGYLSQVFGKTKDQIHALYDGQVSSEYIPLGYLTKQELAENYAALAKIDGVHLHSNTTRYYAGDGIASLIVGYTGQPSAEEAAAYRKLGYAGDEKVGKAGVEQWGEKYLAGRPQATLFVIPPGGGTAVQTLAQSPGEPGQSITTTLDRDLQNRMERTLMDDYIGAAVVMRPDTGEVLAMLSNPTYDSNILDAQNYFGTQQLAQVLANPALPMFNRASQGQYPLGSVFKLITMPAALGAGYSPSDTFDCASYFYDTAGHAYADWTVEHKQPPQGILTMTQAVERSCDTYFYHLGFELFHKDPWIVPNMARGYGLGKLTGIDAVPESAGYVPDPANKKEKYNLDWTEGDAINQAIGQGELQVTPLQVVDYVAAIGNGGTLYKPHLIASVKSADGTTTLAVSPESRGTLPVSAQTLAAVQEGMRQAIYGAHGTGRSAMLGMSDSVKIAGKTGTATTSGESDAWFAAYTYSGTYRNQPDIAVVVLAEHAGEGSQIAAPMARRIFELYYFGRPLNKYPWEATYGIKGTPTPLPTNTPTEESTPTPAPPTS
jgi:penicillin-binding protein 2